MLKVSYEALNMAVADLQRSAGNIEERLDELEARIRSKADQWDGEARGSFEQARGEWSAAMRDMRQVLSEIAGTVQRSNDSYMGAEQANAGRFRG